MRIIGYSSIEKCLITYPGLKELDISDNIAMTLKKRGCAGTWDGDTYYPCDSDVSPYCSKCGAPDPCVICRGDCSMQIKKCCISHSVYLAIFAPGLIKVGVTKTARLETRLMEQGADIGFELTRLPDGEAARKLERSMAATMTDKVSFYEKLNSVNKKVSEKSITKVYREHLVLSEFKFSYFKKDLHSMPIVINLKEGMALNGNVLGIKGQVLVIEKRSTAYAINLDSLLGYDIEIGKCPVKLQSSLSEYSSAD
jgi:hypothetical protein